MFIAPPHGSSGPPHIEILDGLGFVGCLVLFTYVAAVCASNAKGKSDESGKESHEERTRRSIKMRDRLNTADTIGMATNELYTMNKNARTSTMHIREAVEDPREGDLDEDELANAKMQGTLARHRAHTLAKASKNPRSKTTDTPSSPGSLITPSSPGSSPRMRLASDEPPWLHANVKKRDAIGLLQSFPRETTEGSLFLVRVKNASLGQFALDVLPPGSRAIESFLIKRAVTGAMEMDGILLKSGARNVESVIAELYANNQFCVPLSEYVPAPDLADGERAPTLSDNNRLSETYDGPQRAETNEDEELEI
eukprot:m.274577 g.274577  ORF g.274577 m.274577 type:complete len:310 (+) comp26901_c1_seq1:593-1522(+)